MILIINVLFYKASDTTGEDIIIFPLSSVAFMLLNSDKVMSSSGDMSSLDVNVVERFDIHSV